MFSILVADDDKNTRKLMRAVLERENYTVITAENGEDMPRKSLDAVTRMILSH